MPVAVELFAQKMGQWIIKFDGVEGEIIARNGAPIDAALRAYGAASTPAAFAACDGSVFKGLGASESRLGAGLQDLASVNWGASRNPLAQLFDGDMAHAGADLKSFGAHIADLANARSHDGLVAAENRLHPDLMHLQSDFAALGAETSKLIHDLAPAYSALGAALRPMADEFAHIAADFAAIDKAFGDGGGAGRAFATLASDVAALDGSLHALGLLLPAVQKV
jgi:hypothetical protein